MKLGWVLGLASASALILHAHPSNPQTPPAPNEPATIAAAPNDHVKAVETALRGLLDDRHLKDAQIGVAVLDLTTGHLLAAANEHQALNPASNAKLFTAGAALSLLHADHRYETVLLGSAKDGEVSGNLTLRGDGDPSLSTEELAEMVDELRARGIRRIAGDIVVDQHFFDAETTPPAFEQQPNEWSSFRAPISAVAVDENTLTLTVKPGKKGEGAHVSFDPPGFVDQEGSVTTSEGSDTVGLALSGNGKRMKAVLSGSVGEDAKLVRYVRRVEDPTLLAGYTLRALLEREGIKVSGEVKEGTTTKTNVLVRRNSPPLSQILYELGKASNNFYAEMVFKSLGGELRKKPAKSKDSAEIVTQWLKGMGAWENGMVIKNGSGLFDANRVTATSVVQMLKTCFQDPVVAPEYLSQLAIGGVDGTLRKRFRADRKLRAVRAKTGTLEDVAALSGYIIGPNGKGSLAFSLMVNHAAGKVSSARTAMDKFVRTLIALQYGKLPPEGPSKKEKDDE